MITHSKTALPHLLFSHCTYGHLPYAAWTFSHSGMLDTRAALCFFPLGARLKALTRQNSHTEVGFLPGGVTESS